MMLCRQISVDLSNHLTSSSFFVALMDGSMDGWIHYFIYMYKNDLFSTYYNMSGTVPVIDLKVLCTM